MAGPWNNVPCLACPRRGLIKNMMRMSHATTGSTIAYLCKTCARNAELRGELVHEREPSRRMKKP